MSNQQTALTDEALERQRTQAKHNRSEKISDTCAKCLNWAIYLLFIFAVLLTIYFTALYCMHLYNDTHAIEKLESIATHLFAGVCGFLAHLVKKAI